MSEVAILIVDDIENNRVALNMRLELAGYDNVTEASNGREALDLMRAQAFDLVLLDIMMPEMDGYQVLAEMKADTLLREVPVIMISAVDEIDSVVRCIELGAADYLSKPFNPALLKARIGTYVEKARYREQEIAYHQQVEEEKKRADDLLATLVPKQIARVLKANKKLAPIRYDDVTVLFCDVVGFTAYAETHPAEEVFDRLEAMVEAFEDLVDERGMMKIKTIGDAFMVTANLLQDLDEPVREAVDCGLGMVAAADRLGGNWQVRVGIDHGPVRSSPGSSAAGASNSTSGATPSTPPRGSKSSASRERSTSAAAPGSTSTTRRADDPSAWSTSRASSRSKSLNARAFCDADPTGRAR